MKCPECQSENADTAKFCGRCGLSLLARIACPRCQHENPPDFSFCEECGQPLSARRAKSPIVKDQPSAAAPTPASVPKSFGNGRYQVKRFTGTGLSTSGMRFCSCIPRHVGGAAALLESYDEARAHYSEAIRVCTEIHFYPELALTRLQVAELLLDHYPDEKKDAVVHLDFAIREFREMKMQPGLERALRRKEILKA
jgi:hypothetical protein